MAEAEEEYHDPSEYQGEGDEPDEEEPYYPTGPEGEE